MSADTRLTRPSRPYRSYPSSCTKIQYTSRSYTPAWYPCRLTAPDTPYTHPTHFYRSRLCTSGDTHLTCPSRPYRSYPSSYKTRPYTSRSCTPTWYPCLRLNTPYKHLTHFYRTHCCMSGDTRLTRPSRPCRSYPSPYNRWWRPYTQMSMSRSPPCQPRTTHCTPYWFSKYPGCKSEHTIPDY
jgi:hypothetical protein